MTVDLAFASTRQRQSRADWWRLSPLSPFSPFSNYRPSDFPKMSLHYRRMKKNLYHVGKAGFVSLCPRGATRGSSAGLEEHLWRTRGEQSSVEGRKDTWKEGEVRRWAETTLVDFLRTRVLSGNKRKRENLTGELTKSLNMAERRADALTCRKENV